MKTKISPIQRLHPGRASTGLLALLTVSAFILSTNLGFCDRGNEYTTSRGGTAYVGPNGAAAKGANGNTYAHNRNTGTSATGQKNSNGSTTYNTSNGGKAYVGPNGAAARGANGNSAAVTKNGYATSSSGKTTYNNTSYNSYHGSSTTVNVNSVHYNSYYPHGYYNTVPTGYSRVYYGGYHCYYVGGVYYRPTVYQGATIYVVVR